MLVRYFSLIPGLKEKVAGDQVVEIAGCASAMGGGKILEVGSRARKAVYR